MGNICKRGWGRSENEEDDAKDRNLNLQIHSGHGFAAAVSSPAAEKIKSPQKEHKHSPQLTKELVTEESVIIWKIKNFAELQKIKTLKNEGTSLQFCAGESLNQPSTWRFGLYFRTANEIGLQLNLEQIYEPGKSVTAGFSVLVNDPNSGDLVAVITSRNEYNMTNNSSGRPRFVALDLFKTAGALINDILTIHIKLVIYGDEMAHKPVPQIDLNETALEEIKEKAKKFAALLETGEGSDLVIRVKIPKPDILKHEEKMVTGINLPARYSVLKAILGSPMSEKESGTMTIEDMTRLNTFLHYIYTKMLQNERKLVSKELQNSHQNLLSVKIYCDCNKWLHNACTADNAFALLQLAKTYGLQEASKNISHFIRSNIVIVLSKEKPIPF